MDASHGDRLKVSKRVRAQHQGVVQLDRALQVGSGDDGADSRNRVGVVDLKFSRIVVSLRTPRRQQVQEHLEVVQIFTRHVRHLKPVAVNMAQPQGKS